MAYIFIAVILFIGMQQDVKEAEALEAKRQACLLAKLDAVETGSTEYKRVCK